MSKWDEKYSENGFYYGLEVNDFLGIAGAHFETGQKILSLGEGEGRNGLWLLQQGCDLTAVDLSAVAKEKAQKLWTEKGFKADYWVGDIASLELGAEVFDGAVAIWCHMPPETRKIAYRKLWKALKKNALVVMEVYGPEQIKLGTGGPKDLSLLPSLEQCLQEMEGFKPLLAQSTRRFISEGQGHHGLSETLQFVFQKYLA